MKRLETKRLVLREIRETDAEGIFAYYSDRETCYLDGGYEPVKNMDEAFFDTVKKLAQDEKRYAVALRDSDRMVGTVHVMKAEGRVGKAKELGYVIAPGYRRKGYAYEALSAVIRSLFEEDLADMILLSAYTENLPSIRLIEKLGFTKEGILHRSFYYPPVGICDLASYYLERG